MECCHSAELYLWCDLATTAAFNPAEHLWRASVEAQERKRLRRARERRATQRELATWFREIGEPELGSRVQACCAEIVAAETADGMRYLAPRERCEVRMCPACASRRAARLARKYEPKIRLLEKDHRVRFLTLTIPNVPTLTRDVLANLFAAWVKLRRQKLFAGVVASLAALEITKGVGGWHPHLHILVIGGGYIPQDEIADAWEQLTGGRIVHIEKTDSGRLRELLKYPCKPATVESAADLAEVWAAIRGLKLVRAAGKLWNLKDDGEDAGELDPDEPDLYCGLPADANVVWAHAFPIDSPLLDDFLNGVDLDEIVGRMPPPS